MRTFDEEFDELIPRTPEEGEPEGEHLLLDDILEDVVGDAMDSDTEQRFWVSKWGYGQTNVDFYVEEKRTETSVWLTPVKSVEEHSADHSRYLAKPMEPTTVTGATHRYKVYVDGDAVFVKSPLGIIRPWSGVPVRGSDMN